MPRKEALVTPSVMKWAREAARLDITTAARKIGRPATEIQRWEAGQLYPTIAQARKACEVYKRSLAVFYLAEPPKEFETLRDFRYLPDDHSRQYSTELLLLIRQIYSHMEWFHEYLNYAGLGELRFVGSATISIPPKELALRICSQLGVTPTDQLNAQSTRDVLNVWIDKAESIGINVCRQGGITCEEARGFVISDKLAPFIYINSSDALAGQLFSLAHELTHLWLGQSCVSNLEGLESEYQKLDIGIEVFCNQVASEALIDRDTFDRLLDRTRGVTDIEKKIEIIADNFKVSEESIARRLLDLGLIGAEVYRALRQLYRDRWLEFSKQRRGKTKGGPSYHLIKAISNGKQFTRSVISAYEKEVVLVIRTGNRDL